MDSLGPVIVGILVGFVIAVLLALTNWFGLGGLLVIIGIIAFMDWSGRGDGRQHNND